ncbi:hypothetical protein S83_028595, partial [Arachis hypogaea]
IIMPVKKHTSAGPKKGNQQLVRLPMADLMNLMLTISKRKLEGRINQRILK